MHSSRPVAQLVQLRSSFYKQTSYSYEYSYSTLLERHSNRGRKGTLKSQECAIGEQASRGGRQHVKQSIMAVTALLASSERGAIERYLLALDTEHCGELRAGRWR